mgnify:CR=1 FL=1
MATKEFFPGIGKIQFEGKESRNPMAFRYYDANKVILGKKMSEWLKFAMAWWHTLCAEGGDQFGGGTKTFPWNGAACPVQAAKDKVDAGFEFMQKMGIEYYCFHDVDLVDEGANVEEYEARLKEVVAYLKEKGLICKLMMNARKEGDVITACVEPVAFPATSLEANVKTNNNLITLVGDKVGTLSFYGQGAGRYPTAYNVVQDCVDILSGKGFYCSYGEKVTVDNSEKLCYYVRGEQDTWLEANTAENCGGAVLTKPVSVSDMHAWLKAHPGAFIAALNQ